MSGMRGGVWFAWGQDTTPPFLRAHTLPRLPLQVADGTRLYFGENFQGFNTLLRIRGFIFCFRIRLLFFLSFQSSVKNLGIPVSLIDKAVQLFLFYFTPNFYHS